MINAFLWRWDRWKAWKVLTVVAVWGHTLHCRLRPLLSKNVTIRGQISAKIKDWKEHRPSQSPRFSLHKWKWAYPSRQHRRCHAEFAGKEFGLQGSALAGASPVEHPDDRRRSSDRGLCQQEQRASEALSWMSVSRTRNKKPPDKESQIQLIEPNNFLTFALIPLEIRICVELWIRCRSHPANILSAKDCKCFKENL